MNTTSTTSHDREHAHPEPVDPMVTRLAVAIVTEPSLQAAFDLLHLSNWLTEERSSS